MADALGILGTVADLAGLATKIGTAIPGLKKPKKRDTTQRAVRAAGQQAGAAAVGGSQAGFGASRGLALRSGLRAASDVARATGDAAITAANADQTRYDAQRTARNARVASFGNELTGMAGQVGAGIVDASAAKAADAASQAAAKGMLPSQAEVAGVDPNTGLAVQDPTTDIMQAGNPMPQIQQDGAQDPNLGNYSQQLQGPQGAPLTAPPTSAFDSYNAALGINPNVAYHVAPAMEHKLRVTNLALQEAERTGTDPASVIAYIMRKVGLNPMDLQDPGYNDPAHQDGEY